MQIRTVTREDVTEYWRTSKAQGKDLGEVMDRAGVLLTPERLAAIRAICLDQIAQQLEDTPMSYYTQGYRVTATDLQSHLARVIRNQAASELERSRK